MSRRRTQTSQPTAAARCKFCDQPGITEEHIIPQSWDAVLDGGMGDIPGHTLWFVHKTYEPINDGPQSTLLHEKRAKHPAFVTRNFCQPCQGGWMRELDESVRDLLFSLRPDESVTLDAAQQTILACWATKTILAFMTKESDARQTEFGVLPTYRQFGDAQQPLPGMQVWIGAHEQDSPGWFRPHSASWRAPDGASSSGFGGVLTIGHVVIVLLAYIPGDWQARLRYEPAMALKQIWPPRDTPLPWPPRLTFAKRDMTELVESLHARLKLIPSG